MALVTVIGKKPVSIDTYFLIPSKKKMLQPIFFFQIMEQTLTIIFGFGPESFSQNSLYQHSYPLIKR